MSRNPIATAVRQLRPQVVDDKRMAQQKQILDEQLADYEREWGESNESNDGSSDA